MFGFGWKKRLEKCMKKGEMVRKERNIPLPSGNILKEMEEDMRLGDASESDIMKFREGIGRNSYG